MRIQYNNVKFPKKYMYGACVSSGIWDLFRLGDLKRKCDKQADRPKYFSKYHVLDFLMHNSDLLENSKCDFRSKT